jgi:superkiller protein 3
MDMLSKVSYTWLFSLSQERPPIKVVSTLGVIALVSSDEDLIDAALSELRSLPLERRALDDPSCRTDLVLYTNAIAQGDDQEALAILEAAVRIEPSSSSTRNKLANSLIATDKAEEAIGLLALQERGDDSTTVAETLRLRGIAEILGGDEEGVRRLQQAVRARPWEESGWQALTWGRTTVAEAKA